MTDPTERALLRGIIANPDDDTARLVYADWLDEHGQHERAELIRAQVELRPLHEAGHGAGASKECPVSVEYRADKRPGGQMFPKCRRCEHAFDLEQRTGQLLHAANRREWQWVSWGIGCAFDRLPGGQATPHVRRGFVERVEVPALSWVFEQIDPAETRCDVYPPELWRVTPWALAVGGAHPVTEFVIGDREPARAPVNGGVMFGWNFGNGDEPHRLPKILPYFPETAWFDSREKALSALATAAADWVRAAVVAEWAKEVRT